MLRILYKNKKWIKITQTGASIYKLSMRLSFFGHLEAYIYYNEAYIYDNGKTWMAHVINKKFWWILEDFRIREDINIKTMNSQFFWTAEAIINKILKLFVHRAHPDGRYKYTYDSLPSSKGQTVWVKLALK